MSLREVVPEAVDAAQDDGVLLNAKLPAHHLAPCVFKMNMFGDVKYRTMFDGEGAARHWGKSQEQERS